MKVHVKELPAHEDDCLRYDYVTEVGGQNILLSASSLGSYWTYLEIVAEVEKRWPGAEIDTSACSFLTTKEPLPRDGGLGYMQGRGAS